MSGGGAPYFGWDPADYLLRGIPTSRSQVRAVLEKITTVAGAQDTVMIAVSGTKVLRSVSMATRRTPGGVLIGEALQRGPAIEEAATPLAEMSEEEFLSFLHQQPFAKALGAVGEQIKVVLSRRRPSSKGASAHLVTVGCAGPTPLEVRNLVDQLELMINTMITVDIAHDLALSAKITKLGDRLPMLDAVLVNPVEVDELFRAFLLAIEADGVAMYEASPGEALNLVRSSVSKRAIPLDAVSLQDGANVNAVALTQRRPVLLGPDNAGIALRSSGPAELTSAWICDEGSHGGELSIPIPSSPMGRLGPPYGVLSVWRSAATNRGRSFSRYDLSVARNLGLRLGFIVHLNRLLDAQMRLAAIISAGTPKDSPWTTREALFSISETEAEGIPADLDPCRDSLAQLVRALRSATSATSCSMRLLLPGDGRHRRKREWSLVRFVANPAHRMRDAEPSLSLASPSVHSWVARTGEYCYLPDVFDANLLAAYSGLTSTKRVRTTTRSELCVPVVADGRLVGTINLESNAQDAFALHLGTAHSFAAAAGQQISEARRHISERTLSFTSAVHTSSHQILQILDSIHIQSANEEADGLPESPFADEIARIEGLLSADAGSSFIQVIERPGPTLRSVVELVAQHVQMDHLTISVSESFDRLLSSRVVQRLRFALTDILGSIQREMSRKDGDRAQVDARSTSIGGVPYVDLAFMYPTSWPVAAGLSSHLYRVPIWADTAGADRPHLGSYTAGALLRSVGADAHFRVVGKARAETIVSIPISPT